MAFLGNGGIGMNKLNSSRMVMFFSVIIAAFLWFMAMGDLNPSRTVKYSGIPINTYGLRNGLVISSELRKTVDVEVTGRRSELSSVGRSDLGISIDFSKYGAGEHEIRFRDSEKINQSNVTVRYKPETMKVKIENLMNRVYDIETDIQGTLPSGYDKQNIALSTATCTVEGPESKVMKVYRVLARLDANSINNQTELNANLIPVDTKGNEVEGVELNIKSVKVLLPVEKSSALNINPNITGEPKEGYKVDRVVVSPETVNLIKENDDVRDISSVETEAFDITGISEDTEKSVSIVVPEGYRLTGSNKVLLKVLIRESSEDDKDEDSDSGNPQSRTLNINLSSANISGLSGDIELSNSSELNRSITVEVEGNTAQINNLTESSFSAGVDLSQISSTGTFEAPVQVNITNNPNIKIKSFSPSTIPVSVVKKDVN